MTRQDQFERRLKMAQEVALGTDVGLICRTYKVTIVTLQAACKEHSVKWPRQYSGTSGTTVRAFTMYRLLIETTMSYAEIAKEVNVTKQRVGQIVRDARSAGLEVRS